MEPYQYGGLVIPVLSYLREIMKKALDRHLNRFITLLLTEGPYGKYLFGQERGLETPESPEPNTNQEDDLLHAIELHHFGHMDQLGMLAPGLAAMSNKGEYQDILKSPDAYCYRFLFNLDEKTLTTITGQPHILQDGVDVVDGGLFVPLKRPHASWTLHNDKEHLMGVSELLQVVGTEEGKFQALCVARTGDNPGKFIFNPDEIAKIPQLEGFADHEREVVSVGRIKLTKVIYLAATEQNQGDNKFMTSELIKGL